MPTIDLMVAFWLGMACGFIVADKSEFVDRCARLASELEGFEFPVPQPDQS